MAWFAWDQTSGQLDDHALAENVQELTRVAMSGTSLLNGLQRERGLSGAALANDGGTARFATALSQARKTVDTRYREFREVVEAADLGVVSKQHGSLIGGLLNRLEGINTLRDSVSRGDYTSVAAVTAYTDLTNSLVSIAGLIPELTPSREMSRKAKAYASIIEIQEQMGLERSMAAFALIAFGYGNRLLKDL